MELYNTLKKNEFEITNDKKQLLAYYLSQLEKQHQEICLALILERYYRDTKSETLQKRSLPFGGSTILKGHGARFVVSSMPEELICVLMAYIELGSGQKLF